MDCMVYVEVLEALIESVFNGCGYDSIGCNTYAIGRLT